MFVVAITFSWAGPGFFQFINESTSNLMDIFGPLYLILGFLAVVIGIILSIHPISKKKLGEGKPQYGLWSWIAMLYSTGMGSGLLLRAVQEPVFFLHNPPRVSGHSAEVFALEYTFFHWGLTPWAFYGLTAILVGWFYYRGKKSFLFSELLLGYSFKNKWGGDVINFLIIVTTFFGALASIGLGSRQLLASGQFWAGPTWDAKWAFIPLAFLCIAATFSALLGIKQGIKRLSNLNIAGGILLLAFAWIQGPILDTLRIFSQSLGYYLLEWLPMSLNLGQWSVSNDFLKNWTVFYWAFWLAWAPFTGIFIARISQGRSIREVLLGTLFIPSVGTFLWFSIFGNHAFDLIANQSLTAKDLESVYRSIFMFFGALPFSKITQFLSSFFLATFLITSIDSAIFVLSMYLDSGKREPKKRFRFFWGIAFFVLTALVLWNGSEQLLLSISTILILSSLPFAVVFLPLLFFLFKNLNSTSHDNS
nr:BCCT family transporter [Algoriphagus sp.]